MELTQMSIEMEYQELAIYDFPAVWKKNPVFVHS